ncbi:DUF72 domain-containing protein [Kineosporia corallincola]
MWTHRSWTGSVVPKNTGSQDKLRFYSSWCNAVEGNTTFYATPARETVGSWAGQTPGDFRFVVKLPRAITHEKRFRGIDDDLRNFLRVIEPLGPRLESLWIQLPGSFAPGDVAALDQVLRRLPREHRYSVEVRHPLFFTDPTELNNLEKVCAATGTEWVPFDTTAFFAGGAPTSDAEREAWERKPRLPRRSTALTARPIVRYLGRDDETKTVAGWQHWVGVVAGWLQEGRSPTFFLHTPGNHDAPALARRFHDEVRARVPALEPLPEPEPVEPETLF